MAGLGTREEILAMFQILSVIPKGFFALFAQVSEVVLKLILDNLKAMFLILLKKNLLKIIIGFR